MADVLPVAAVEVSDPMGLLVPVEDHDFGVPGIACI